MTRRWENQGFMAQVSGASAHSSRTCVFVWTGTIHQPVTRPPWKLPSGFSLNTQQASSHQKLQQAIGTPPPHPPPYDRPSTSQEQLPRGSLCGSTVWQPKSPQILGRNSSDGTGDPPAGTRPLQVFEAPGGSWGVVCVVALHEVTTVRNAPLWRPREQLMQGWEGVRQSCAVFSAVGGGLNLLLSPQGPAQ